MILCAGEALIDMLPRRSEAGEDAFAPHAGGSVFNTAVALGRLGAPVRFFSGLSSDLFGDRLRAVLDEAGVDHSPALTSCRPTTLAFVRLRDGQATYTFYDENSAMRMLGPDDMPPADAADVLFFGCISLAAEPCGAAYEELMLAAAPERVTMVDTNIRPGFVEDEAVYRDRLLRMTGAADIVKASDEDLRWLEGDGELAELARGVLDRGARIVCVTEGARGVTAYRAEAAVHVPAAPAQVVDTVGAGDTFNAGLLTGLHEAGALTKAALGDLPRETLRAALELGARAAAVTVSRAGANPPRRGEL